MGFGIRRVAVAHQLLRERQLHREPTAVPESGRVLERVAADVQVLQLFDDGADAILPILLGSNVVLRVVTSTYTSV